MYAKPGAAGHQITASQQRWLIRPWAERGGGAVVRLVAIGGDHQRKVGVRLDGEKNQAHGVASDPAAARRP